MCSASIAFERLLNVRRLLYEVNAIIDVRTVWIITKINIVNRVKHKYPLSGITDTKFGKFPYRFISFVSVSSPSGVAALNLTTVFRVEYYSNVEIPPLANHADVCRLISRRFSCTESEVLALLSSVGGPYGTRSSDDGADVAVFNETKMESVLETGVWNRTWNDVSIERDPDGVVPRKENGF